MRFMHSAYKTLLFFLCILFLIPGFSFGSDSAKITDSAGNHLVFTKKPERVVCLRAYITEIIYRFGEGKCITGLTKQDLGLNPTSTAKNVGSYFYPDIKAIIDCKPDLIIAAPSHKKIIDYFKDKPCRIMVLKENSINDAFIQMEMISKIFNCLPEARKVIESNREKLAIVKARADKIPNEKRKRVVRVMAGTGISCPGDDSFQMEMIKAAGGIPLKTGKNGFAVQVGLKQWQDFNPQFIYGCNDNKKAVTELINRKGWKDVDAVKNGSVTMFPCRLTCQVSTNIGDFIQWLAATVYLEDFADQDKAATEDTVLEKTLIKVDVPYLKNTEIVRHRVADAEYKSLVVNFKTKQDIASTFEGNLSNLIAAGNTYVPMHASLGQMAFGVDRAKAAIKKNLGFNENEFTTLMTGADMDNLSIQKRTYKDLEVTALVTAGVRGNALRASKDTGSHYTHGTINIIILTNRRLTPNAMLRAIITATEAKTAALLDMDIRSTYTSVINRATGTGTDNIMVVRGDGPAEKYTGGHTKTGELIAKAVHAGVTEAIYKQNGIKTSRNISQRLGDRRLKISEIVGYYSLKTDKIEITEELEKLLALPFYSSFIETAFTISDEYEKGLISDLAPFEEMCIVAIKRISGSNSISLKNISEIEEMPAVMSKAFGSLIYGITLTRK